MDDIGQRNDQETDWSMKSEWFGCKTKQLERKYFFQVLCHSWTWNEEIAFYLLLFQTREF